MRRTSSHVGVATESSVENIQSSKLLGLAVPLALAALTVGCGAASPAVNAPARQAIDRVAVPAPAQAKLRVVSTTVTTARDGVDPYIFAPDSGSLPVSDPPRTEHGSNPAHLIMVGAPAPNHQAAITIYPGNTTVASQGVQQFTANVTGTADTAVTWSASAGSISSSGKFIAPTVSSTTPVTITSTSATDSSLHATATVNVTGASVSGASKLDINTSSLVGGHVGKPYTDYLSASGGVSPYQWRLAAGTLPSGIHMQSTGVLAGTASVSGSYPFTVKVTDAAGNSSTQDFTLSVASNSTSEYDGPAELPRVYIQTAMANTPAPGNTIFVAPGGDLQAALNSAECGDTISLRAGTTFPGSFTFPAKNCDENHWIVVRTSASDSVLPAEGSRLTPCYAGVASLPGRPDLHCASTSNVLAKLLKTNGGLGPIVFAPGANYYRLVGLEITRAERTGIVYALSSVKTGGTASNLILDRVWVHGTAQDETNKGLELGGTSYVSVIDSYFSDLHCVAVSGACTDSSAISGGAQNPAGPFKIVNNFLEASGENVMFGGAASATTPADIEIRQNHLFKPLTWMRGQPGYVGGSNGNPFIVKNLLELKNAQRVLIEANIMDDNWGGFSQKGYAIVITPKNQAGNNGTNLCPNCLVTDVTIRYSTSSHTGAGLQIANALSDNHGAARDGERYSIHDLILDDIDPVKYNGSGRLAEIVTGIGAPILQNVQISHLTAFPTAGLFTVGGSTTEKMSNFIFSNSLVTTGSSAVWSSGGGKVNCAYYDKPLTTFNACFGPYWFSHNALIGAAAYYPASYWPAGNFFPAASAEVQFSSFSNGIGGDYRLLPSSPYKNAGTDGKDLGADIETIVSETAGVY